ncbi:hypothetical protein [Pleionea sp. CnH1-48]|uniref:hypothetical protein n=1 Tax=Pleionea sp. CnH1-48 TaxID=2954494 RepID=UPI002096BD56|nr:hypothetical protein [Pleionea sp. CnH1-48]MCO7224745.1 hypothetical protein [Pleionea sp. CnH1-48]
MKILIGLVCLQTIVLVFLAAKIFSIEEQVIYLKPESQRNYVEVRTDDAQYEDIEPETKSITLTDIQQVVKKELALALSELNLSSESSHVSLNSQHEAESSPEAVMSVDESLDLYLSDGDFSLQEQGEFEKALAQLNHSDRKKLLQSMSKKLTQQKIAIYQ